MNGETPSEKRPIRSMNSLNGTIDPEFLAELFDMLATRAPEGATVCRVRLTANNVSVNYDMETDSVLPLSSYLGPGEKGGKQRVKVTFSGWSDSKCEEVIAMLWTITAFGLLACDFPWWLVVPFGLKALNDHLTAFGFALKEMREHANDQRTL
jgi:hypothetical protein